MSLLSHKKIEKMSDRELRIELAQARNLLPIYKRAANCFHEKCTSNHHVSTDIPEQEVTVYHCSQCNYSWSD